MQYTEVIVAAEGLVLICPHCDSVFDQINVHRYYELDEIECFNCLGSSTLTLTLEPR